MKEAHQIAAIINFCSNDYAFLEHNIKSLQCFAEHIIIPVCTHFFDGVAEDKQYLESIYAEHPHCTFIEFEYDPEKNRCAPINSTFWPNLSRMIGFYFLDVKVDYILFLDADEIIDETRFMPWLDTLSYKQYEVMQLACYWYFRDCTYRAAVWEDTPLMVKKTSVNVEMMMEPLERGALFSGIQGPKKRHLLGTDGKPMIHHFSWVRTKEQMLRKVLSWSARAEKNWAALVEEEFERPCHLQDFVHGYPLEKVQPFIKIDLEKKPPRTLQTKRPQNVIDLSTEQIHRLDLSLRFNL